MKLRCANLSLDLSTPKVMGILNVTPDSFSDGGKFHHIDAALTHAQQMIEQGADIIDIGGESTRPGAQPVMLEEELQRVIPVIQALSGCGAVLSVDTYKPEVMRAAIEAGVHMVNDVFALQQPGALQAVQDSQVAICLMHMQGTPQTMQVQPSYQNVLAEVQAFLTQRVEVVRQIGVGDDRIVLDPGFGFGKKTAHNLTLLKHLAELHIANLPILAGLSRKSVLGQIVGQDADQRVFASVAASVLAVSHGANIVRVHDVKATVEALKVTTAVMQHL
ncbi:MAG: dihydropteroate synthase [Candidatus Methylopumilus sp.]|mgnify:CR=1 FL=1|jgi:dihydropteroate synthase|nr:dihydropteroate synthase [Candidatus Methylopumilus sp.]